MTLEQLLNKLIQRGWKPFGGPYYNKFIIESDGDMCFRWRYPGTDGTHSYDYNFDYFKIRELASKESGLWQFVCENGMIENPREDFRWTNDFQLDYIEFNQTDFQYWLIESALCNEENLEKFLLENIKIDG